MIDDSTIAKADEEGRAHAVRRARTTSEPMRLTQAWREGHGYALRILRQASGLSLEQVAERVRTQERTCSRSLVDGWERGYSYPSQEHHLQLSRLYGIPYARLAILGQPTVGETTDGAAAVDPWAVGRE